MQNNILEFKNNTILKTFVLVFTLYFSLNTVSYLVLVKSAFVEIFIKLLFSFCYIYLFLNISKWSNSDKIAGVIFLLFTLRLIAESIFKYNSILIHPTVLAVISPFLYVYVLKNMLLKFNVDVLKSFIKVIFISYIIFMLIFGRDFGFSNASIHLEELGPFSGDTRILHANSILLFVIPYLYFFNKIIKKFSIKSLIGFGLSFIVILIHQHRTVWVVTIISTIILLRINGKKSKLLKKVFLIAAIITLLFVAILYFNPSFKELLIDRFADILDPLNEDNTAGWRYIQILSYFDNFLQKPIFGWTFDGFRMPNLFLSGLWEEGTGHHFHNAYIEVLFYFGITGLLLKFYPLYKIVKSIGSIKLSDNTKVIGAFCASGFIYSFSYVPPLAFWASVGMCLFYIEKDIKVSRLNVNKSFSECKTQ